MTTSHSKFTTIAVKFLDSPNNRLYTYKAFKPITRGDLVVVKVGVSHKVVRVKEVHEEPKLDPNASYEYKWIIGTINSEEYDKQRTLEDNLNKEIKEGNNNVIQRF